MVRDFERSGGKEDVWSYKVLESVGQSGVHDIRMCWDHMDPYITPDECQNR
jgi:hypothetical protein